MNERLYDLVSNYETWGKLDQIKYLRHISYNLKKIEYVEEENTLPDDSTASTSKKMLKSYKIYYFILITVFIHFRI